MLWKFWNHVHWMFVGVYLHLSDLTQEELKLLNEIRRAKQQLLLEIKVRKNMFFRGVGDGEDIWKNLNLSPLPDGGSFTMLVLPFPLPASCQNYCKGLMESIDDEA